MDINGSCIQNQFCSYEIALKLKELGFNEKCLGAYMGHKLVIVGDNLIQTNITAYEANNYIKAPLWQQCEQWFRDKYNIHITITSQSQESWQWHIQFPHDSLNKMWEEDFYTYEEAREQAILKAIELCKE